MRRIHLDGYNMLEKSFKANLSRQKLVQIENRVKLLQMKEEKSHKMAQRAEDQASRMIDSRKRHFENLVVKKQKHLLQEAEQE